MSRPRTAFESADTVNRVVALMVRFPELHGIHSNPLDATLTLTFAVACGLDDAAMRAFAEVASQHVRAFHELAGIEIGKLAVRSEYDSELTFVHVSRDLGTFSPDELALHVALFADRFGAALVRNPDPDEPADDEPGALEESVEAALDALRDPTRRQRLVGVRDEKRVLVYFVHPGKRAKVRARS